MEKFFLDRGFQPNRSLFDPDNRAIPLDIAASLHNLEEAKATVDILIQYGADVSKVSGCQHHAVCRWGS